MPSSTPRYRCPNCGALSNYARCPQCGTDTEPSEVSQAQQDTLNLLHRRDAVARDRRFTGEPLTGFGGLSDADERRWEREQNRLQDRDDKRGQS
jgi:hypothetical protein